MNIDRYFWKRISRDTNDSKRRKEYYGQTQPFSCVQKNSWSGKNYKIHRKIPKIAS